MNEDNRMQLIVQIAIMYYKEGLTQQEIATKLGIARQTVSKNLTLARQDNIVEIKINNPLKDIEDMSDRLKKEYGLKNAIVVPCRFQNDELIRNALSQSASDFLRAVMREKFKNIALSWGRTVYNIVINMEDFETKGVVIFPLVGSTDRTAPYYMINEMVRMLANNLDASPIYAYIPAHPETPEDRDLYMKTSAFRNISNLWNKIDIALVGIGVNPVNEQNLRERYPGEDKLKVIGEVAGDICTNYFDKEGKFIEALNAGILCASEENLRKAKRVLAVAGGAIKAGAILGALKSGVVTDLITDETACRKVFELSGQKYRLPKKVKK